jgi:hypothetical protein
LVHHSACNSWAGQRRTGRCISYTSYWKPLVHHSACSSWAGQKRAGKCISSTSCCKPLVHHFALSRWAGQKRTGNCISYSFCWAPLVYHSACNSWAGQKRTGKCILSTLCWKLLVHHYVCSSWAGQKRTGTVGVFLIHTIGNYWYTTLHAAAGLVGRGQVSCILTLPCRKHLVGHVTAWLVKRGQEGGIFNIIVLDAPGKQLLRQHIGCSKEERYVALSFCWKPVAQYTVCGQRLNL